MRKTTLRSTHKIKNTKSQKYASTKGSGDTLYGLVDDQNKAKTGN